MNLILTSAYISRRIGQLSRGSKVTKKDNSGRVYFQTMT